MAGDLLYIWKNMVQITLKWMALSLVLLTIQLLLGLNGFGTIPIVVAFILVAMRQYSLNKNTSNEDHR